MHRFRVIATALLAAASLVAVPASATASVAPLTNLAHLDFLTSSVAPPAQAGHSTYRLESEPAIGVLWVYADRQADGSYHRTGGGAYDAATNTFGQGSYDADDISRAAVVYLRHWRSVGDAHSRDEAYELLRNEVESVNATLPPAQRIAKFLLLYKELDADDGELTRTRKVRRSVINEKYAAIIDAIYRGEPAIAIDTVIRFQDGSTQRIRTTLPVIDLGLSAPTPVAHAAE